METVEELKAQLMLYEQNGPAKLYYALNRKMNEMGDLLNSTNLKNVNLDDQKDKTFDRLKVIWKDAAEISQAIEALGKTAGITGKEDEDVSKKPFVETIAQSRN